MLSLAYFTGSLLPPTSLSFIGPQSGYGMPARRLIARACRVRRTTASMSTTSCQGFVRRPSEMISVVAPAGGWGDLNKTIKPEVRPRERAAAMTRDQVTPTARAGPAIVKTEERRVGEGGSAE